MSIFRHNSHPSRLQRLALPRTFAILSCALALLAAQPLAHAATPKWRPAIMTAGPDQLLPGSRLATTQTVAKAAPGVRSPFHSQSIFSSARQLHILATVEILQRLLMAELRPALSQPHSPLAFLLFEPLCVDLVQVPALLPAQSTPMPSHDLPPPMERQFALWHCLLAPPIA